MFLFVIAFCVYVCGVPTFFAPVYVVFCGAWISCLDQSTGSRETRENQWWVCGHARGVRDVSE